MAEGTLQSLEFKKTISTSTKFLEDIWYTWSNHGNNQSKKADGAGRFFNNVKCSNENKNQKTKDSSVYDNVEISSDDGISQNQDNERQTRKHVIPKRHSSRICDVPNFSSPPCKLDSSVPMTDPRWTPDNLLTDALLDKMLIHKVQVNKRLSYFYMQSRVLYKYLSYNIGSESIITLRWKILEKKFSARFYGIPVIISGSKAEGLDMSGSDIDMMIILAKAHEGREYANDYFNFIYSSLEFEECPGYVTVQILIQDQTYALDSSTWKNLILTFLPFFNYALELGIHGPALSGSCVDESFDQVMCLKSETWPKIAEEWIYRKRLYGWPTNEMVCDIVSKGCHIVPISDKINQQCGKEWRLSFSVAEKTLIRSFKHVQILIYGLLKLLLKEVIEKEECLKNLLCSYFLKTTLFWVIEETRTELWDPKYTALCFSICLDRLIGYVIEDNCPNYFVPINNMFLGRFSQSKKERLLHVLFNLYDQGLHWVSHSPKIKNMFQYMKDPYTAFELKELQEIKEKRERVQLVLSFLRMCKLLINFLSQQPKMIIPCIKSFLKIPLIKKSAVHFFSHHINTNDFKMNNKEKYGCEQLVLHMILHGAEIDSMSKYSMLAAWLHEKSRFNDSLQIIDHALITLSRRVFHLGAMELQVMPTMLHHSVDIHDTLRFYSTMNIQIPIVSHIASNDLSYVAQKFLSHPLIIKYARNNPLEMTFDPKLFFYFMKLLCHLKLGNVERYNHFLKEMTNVEIFGSEFEMANHNFMQILLKIAAEVAKRGRDDLECIICEEIISSTDSNLANISEIVLFQGLHHDCDNLILNGMQWLRFLQGK